MKRIAIAVFAATLMMSGAVAVAQIMTDVPDDPPHSSLTVPKRTPAKPAADTQSMFDNASFIDRLSRYPMSRDPMSKGLLNRDVRPAPQQNEGDTATEASPQ